MNIPSSTFDFLNALKENNNREWFHDNKETHDRVRLDFIDFAQLILTGLSEMDKQVPADMPIAKCVFRIYRDIRFSKDKTPYKGYMSAAYSSKGRSTDLPGYYVHIQPGKSFITAGLWHPDKEKLAAIRQEIDYNSEKFRAIVNQAPFRNSVVLDQDDKLKKAPSGYSIDHPDIEFLRLKSFTASRFLEDRDLLSNNADKIILETFSALQPFQEFLYEAIDQEV
ncbi:DUF2461 domain-containing protein [Albibacterium sp.]|uniref:DUF2461 domain-containing protein n=1 Tax=Albibacterium sp. TaxID=2952885 RepID=UPI002BAAC58B|nr:DUF2461 domain-containing protein [Albibacterium sp.]HUH20076.1 DUF2461 domain-containing protein [Albibacterium sp.]